MKNSILIITTLFLLLFGTTQLVAQNFNLKKNNYLVLSKNIQQLKPVMLAAKSLEIEEDKKYGDFYIILCGKTVNNIPNNPDFRALLNEATKQNIKVFACGISLQKFNISQDQLPKNIKITENGILYGLQLTKKGFTSITI
ncbi:sulfur reduction protein DsrE [Polaribacter sp. ALD11]|uniref:DsrE family protein n=1 Tax=Polaribacter sp. ALD11 TaxID=2058137 RepID=UPI000C3151C7|nr:DsrE family protein [Polaribacter sp. ALD11]AUC84010.1 sulfur reduction protein DsrE [Polaribacter sp. ALD11]